jgi:hypothetical protein
MGAIGAATLVHEDAASREGASKFRGFAVSGVEYSTTSFECKSCSTSCEIIRIAEKGKVIACWGGQCDMWEGKTSEEK